MSEKTEQPTSKKLREAREQGQVAHSKDFTQTLLILALFGYLIAMPAAVWRLRPDDPAARRSARPALRGRGGHAADRAGAVAGAAVCLHGPWSWISVLAEMLQVGVLFAFEAIQPSGKKLDMART
jgi:type III secretion protein U